MLIVHGTKDKIIPLGMSQAFATAAKSKGLWCDLIGWPNVEHRLVPWRTQAIGCEDRVTAWVREVMK